MLVRHAQVYPYSSACTLPVGGQPPLAVDGPERLGSGRVQEHAPVRLDNAQRARAQRRVWRPPHGLKSIVVHVVGPCANTSRARHRAPGYAWGVHRWLVCLWLRLQRRYAPVIGARKNQVHQGGIALQAPPSSASSLATALGASGREAASMRQHTGDLDWLRTGVRLARPAPMRLVAPALTLWLRLRLGFPLFSAATTGHSVA